MRPEIIRPLRYCTGIKCLPCTAMMMCWKIRASINFYAGARRGEPGGAGLHRLHTEALWTQTYLTWPGRSQWLILTPGGFTLCDKGSKNVNKLSVSANLSYYLRTAGEKICLVDKCLFSWQKRAQTLCGGGRFWFDVRLSACEDVFLSLHLSVFFQNFQPWNNF